MRFLSSTREFRRRNRGEIHPGLLVAGVIAALGLAWWMARSDASAPTRSPGDPAISVAGSPAVARADVGPTETDGPEKPLYQWTDAAGVVHFTDVAPADRPYKRVDVDPNRNVVRSPLEQ